MPSDTVLQRGLPHPQFSGLIDTRPLRSQDPIYIQEIFHLFIFILGSSIMDTLNRPEHREQIREQLKLRVDILMHGCSIHSVPTLQGGTT